MTDHRTEADKFLRWREEKRAEQRRWRRPLEAGRTCTACLLWKPADKFCRDNDGSLKSDCTACVTLRARIRRRRNPATARRLDRQRHQREKV